MEYSIKNGGFSALHVVEIQGRKYGKIRCYIINRYFVRNARESIL